MTVTNRMGAAELLKRRTWRDPLDPTCSETW